MQQKMSSQQASPLISRSVFFEDDTPVRHAPLRMNVDEPAGNVCYYSMENGGGVVCGRASDVPAAARRS